MSKVAHVIVAAASTVTIVATHLTPIAAQAKSEVGTSPVAVTVKYNGKGTVDAKHKIWVWLFDNPNIGQGSIPIAEQSVEKNGATVTFPNITLKQVYVAVAYDEAGGFAGQAPPPPGSPIAFYGAKAAADPPLPVVPGPKGSVTVTFNDANRMQ
jgi:hypothetical protein